MNKHHEQRLLDAARNVVAAYEHKDGAFPKQNYIERRAAMNELGLTVAAVAANEAVLSLQDKVRPLPIGCNGCGGDLFRMDPKLRYMGPYCAGCAADKGERFEACFEVVQRVADHFENTDAPLGVAARKALDLVAGVS